MKSHHPLRGSGRSVLTLSSLAILAACGDAPLPTEHVAGPRTTPATILLTQSRIRGADREMLEIESNVPGFGGVSVEGDNIKIWVKDRSVARRAEGLIRGRATSPGRSLDLAGGRRRGTIIQQADYTFAELVSWKEAMKADREIASRFRLLDADEGLNRVRVGVRSQADAAVIREASARAGVPAEAIHFEIYDGEFGPSVGTVQGWASIKNAGMKITRQEGSWGTPTGCTAGFTVTSWYTKYFLTAGHCTGQYVGQTGQPWNQPTWGNPIGYVAVNPAWSTEGCAVGAEICNTVDAVMIAFNSGIPSQSYVDQTQYVGTGNSPAPTLLIGPIYPIINSTYVLEGEQVFKTGMTTGTTRGPVLGTCVDLPAYRDIGGTQPWRSLSCQVEVYLQQDEGDSGAPVYMWRSPYSTNSRLAVGIAHTYYWPTGGWNKMYFSPWSALEEKFGALWAGQ